MSQSAGTTPRQLRIVSVVPSLARNTGGPAVTLIQGTRAMGGAVNRTIYATDAAQPAGSGASRSLSREDLPSGAEEVRLRIFRTRRPHQIVFSPGLWTALRRDIPRADLVTIHSLNLFPQFAAFRLATAAKVPYIVTPHGALDPWLTRNSPRPKAIANHLWQRRMIADASAIHFTTAEEGVLAGEIAARTPQVVIPNGLDLRRFSEPRSAEAFRARHLGSHKGPVILFLGRIARKKGIDILIHAFAKLDAKLDAWLVVAGPDDEGLTPELRAEAKRAGLGVRVRFIGPLYDEDHLDALAGSDVWALTSHTENFGNAVIEAMGAGCPVLVSTEVNLASQIRDADAGLVTSLSPDEIAAAINRLLSDEASRRDLAIRGRAFARQFDWSIVAPQLVDMFSHIVGANRVGHLGERPR